MTTKFTNILSLSSEEAVYFLMQDEQYHNYELPEYFNFNLILQHVQEKIGDKSYNTCKSGVDPQQLEGVNLDFNLNKDGRYAIRPLSLCNPYLYYFMVREICGEKNWTKVKDCFSHFAVPHITACAIPVLPTKKEIFHKSTTIFNWWNSMEQRSLELSLEYRYMFITDITNCYGSISPQAIEHALSMAGTQYETTENTEMIASVKQLLLDMQRGRNNGIPQGSALFDLIAEIILGYADLLLHEKIVQAGIADNHKYEILRYRDDYRIFCDDKGALEEISYLLQDVLFSVGFMMNAKKTKLSSDIVIDSVKEDKLAYIRNTPVFKRYGGMDFDGFQKYLMFILMFGREHQDCGTIRTLLTDLDLRIERKLKPRKKKSKVVASFRIDDAEDVFLSDDPSEEKKNLQRFSEVEPNSRKIKENIKVLCGIALQIAIENNAASPYALKVISRLLTVLKDEKDLRDSILNLVREKLRVQHNALYLQVWLQNMTLGLDTERSQCPYSMPLCHLSMGERISIWNNDWLKSKYVKGLPIGSICDKKRILELVDDPTPVIKILIRNSYDDISHEPIE